MWRGLLRVFKALIHLLEAKNTLVGLLVLPHPPGFLSDPTEKEFSRFIGMQKAPKECLVAVPGVPPCSATFPGCPAGAEGCGTELCAPAAQKLGNSLSLRTLQQSHGWSTKLENRDGDLSLPLGSHCGIAPLPSSYS